MTDADAREILRRTVAFSYCATHCVQRRIKVQIRTLKLDWCTVTVFYSVFLSFGTYDWEALAK